MKTRLTLAAITLLCTGVLQAQITQQVTAIQYYFNADPGPGNTGNGDIINITPASDYNASLALSLPGSLNPGIHHLYIRVKDEHSRWSLPERRSFLINKSLISTGDIVAYQYYFNTDAGVGVPGTGAVVDVTPGVVFNQPVAIPLPTELVAGTYNFYFRVQNDLGIWSQAERRTFVVTEALSEDDDLVAYQYYFDTDPGPGVAENGDIVAIPFTMDFNTPVMVEIPTDLSQGIHNLYFRVQNALGVWSVAERRTFLIRQDLQEGSDVVAYQYYFNTDPGVNLPGNGAIVEVTPAEQLSQAIQISLPLGLQDGLHNLYFRVSNADGNWSAPERRLFHVNNHSGQLVEIVALEFYFDDDPGAGNANPYPISATTNLDEVLDFGVPCLDAGEHYFYLRAKDNFGSWSIIERDTITVESDMAAPVITANGPTLLCTGESVELSVDVIPGVMYQWTENNMDIPGETNPTLLVTTTGSYAVKAICGGVFELSNTIEVNFAPLQTYYLDADGDGYGDADQSIMTCEIPAGYVDNATDCKDSDATIYPNAPETCNETDDDCDGAIDEGVQTTFYADADGDGFGNAANSVLACTAPTGYVEDNTDCNDGDPGIHPGATEICNGFDDDCDGLIDEDVQSTFYADADGDGFGDATTPVLACTAPGGYVTDNTDCNDGDPGIHPGATEICNGVDDNCDGEADEGFVYSVAADAILSDMGTEICAGIEIELSVSGGLLGTGAAWSWYSGECDGTFLGIGETLVVTPPAGTQQYSVRAEGTCNHSACTSITIEVRTAPVFTECPMDIITNSDAGNCGAVVSYTIGTSGDPLPALSYVLSGATEGSGSGTGSGEVFNVGITTVTLTAENICGQENCVFLVEVLDNEFPVLVNCPGDIEIFATPGHLDLIEVDWDNPQVSDNCPGVDLSQTYTPPYSFNFGEHLVTYTATDQSGNSASCTFHVTVHPPEFLDDVNLRIFANDISIDPQFPGHGQEIVVTATIHNTSDVDSGPFDYQFTDEFSGEASTILSLPGLGAHSSTAVSWTTTAPEVDAFVPIKVEIDIPLPGGVISETNELDNQAIRSYAVGEGFSGSIDVTAHALPASTTAGSYIQLCGSAEYDDLAVMLSDPSVAGASVEILIQETQQKLYTTTDATGSFCIWYGTPATPGIYHFTTTVTDFTLTGQYETTFQLETPPPGYCPTDLSINLALDGAFIGGSPPYVVTVNTPITGTAYIGNGCQPVGDDIPVSFFAPGNTIPSQEIQGGLGSGETTTRSFGPVVFSTPGPAYIMATVDPGPPSGGMIVEDNETNNTKAIPVTVVPNAPDIVALSIDQSSSLICSGPKLVFNISNIGGASSGGPFVVDVSVFDLDLQQYVLSDESLPIPELAPGEKFLIEYAYTPSYPANYRVEIFCDPDGAVAESNEGNNALSHVMPFFSCAADIAVWGCGGLDVQPPEPEEGQNITVAAVIENVGSEPALAPFYVEYWVEGVLQDVDTIENDVPVNTTLTSEGEITAPLESSIDKSLLVIVTGVQNESKITNNLSPGVLCFDFHLTNELHQQRQAMKTTQFICNPAQFGIGLLNFGLYEVLNLEVEFNISGPGIIGEETIGSAFTQLDYRCACPQVSSLETAYLFPEIGTYQVRILVDPDGQYVDCNPGDNELILDVHVVENADYAVLSQYIAPSTLNPQPGEQVTFNLSYENSGCHGVQDIGLALVIDEELPPLWNTTVPALNNEDLGTVGPSPSWSSSLPGVHIARLFVDYDDLIPESNELNNEATRAIVVGRGADLSVAVSPSDPQPHRGDLIYLETEIQNLSAITGAPASTGLLSLYYIGEAGTEVPIAQQLFDVSEASAITISVPWIVQDRNALLIARITNQDPVDVNTENDEDAYRLSPLQVTLLVTDAPCDGIHPGQIEAIVSGGTPPYVIDWDNGMTGRFINVFEGTYTVYIPDARGTLIEAQAVVGTVAYPTTWYADADGDSYGDPNSPLLDCTQPEGYVADHSDCDDNDSEVHPDAHEICNGFDNDCDGLVDDADDSVSGQTVWHQDSDHDGFATANISVLACYQPAGYILLDPDSVDCNDLDTLVNPAAQEVCNGIDDDCDGLTDDADPSVAAQATWYLDQDGDGFGDPDIFILACVSPDGYVGTGTDCNDSSIDVYPGAPEILDGLDNDCDGQIDEGLTQMSVDIGECETVLFGYAPEEGIEVEISIVDGTAPYTYLWNTGETTEFITVCPEETTTYAVTVTDAIGQVAADELTVQVFDIRCGNGNQEKILICHLPPGNPENIQTICVSINALEAHLDHGDLIGMCNPVDPCEGDGQAIGLPDHADLPEIQVDHTVAGIHGDAGDELHMHPNPAQNSVEIHASDFLQRLIIYNATGVVLMDVETEGSHANLHLEQLHDGMYFVVAMHLSGHLQTGKLLVVK